MVGVAADFSAISSGLDSSLHKNPHPEIEADESPLSGSGDESQSMSPSPSMDENDGKLMPNIEEADEYQ